ncbi:tetratricopeptide repeat-containing sensor histidine kinase [Flavobacterium soli]|uniref:tetratricopeptide repeat-containing sensor histidine kinase n=1 Tax=Flavobacterium soli TaxID=344881 RepID=UPI0003F55246|nr:tetratricopeptide repeat-containing sensor histidine kinase [Flavobacterium soli]
MKQLYVLSLLFFNLFAFGQGLSVRKMDSLKLAASKGNVNNRCNSLLLLSDEYSNTDLNLSLKYAKLSLEKARLANNDTLIAVSYNSIANTFQYKSQLDSALIFHKKALHYRKKINDSLGMADSYNNLGITYDSMGLFSESLHQYFRALYFYDKKKDLEKQAMTYTNIGIIYKTQKEYKKAFQYYKKANDLYVKIKSEFGITVSSGNLGSILIDFERYEESLRYSQIAKEGYKKMGYDRFLGYPISNIAIVYDSLHRFQEANKNYIQAIQLHEKYLNSYEVANICNAYAKCLIKQEKFEESILISNKAKEFSKKANAFFLEVNANKNLAKANSALGSFEQAYKYSNLYITGNDSLFETEKTKAIFELETKYNTEKKEKLLIQKEAEVKHRNALLIVLSVLVFSAVLLGYLFYRQQKLKNKQQKQEFQLKSAIAKIETQNKLQDQRLSISRDLHDNIGAQLTFIISSVDNIKYVFDLENTKLDSKLQSISNFTKSTIVELRDTIWAMNNDEISFEDLRMRIFNFIEKAKIATEEIDFKFNIDESLSQLKFTSIKGMNVYRSIQEAINNSIKYAKATEIAIDVKSHGDEIRITISDNGIGFDEHLIVPGNGIQNIRKRIKDIGGRFDLKSEVQSGTTIVLTVPK